MAFCGSIALLLGYLAGLRFRVACILLIEIAAIPAAAGLAMLDHLSVAEAVGAFLVFSLAVQAGYGLALVRPISLGLSGQRRHVKA